MNKKFSSFGAVLYFKQYLYQSDFLFRAIQYTAEEQGKEMACYVDPSYFKVLETL
ncbi:MAG: hypothetical protein Q8L78_07815 [Coxiellaceae bacterium]|nr:hypothetical protein [Coxiellaceae bacterium]